MNTGRGDVTNNIQVFSSEEFGQIRTVEINGEVWLVGKDVADNLRYQNGSRDINRHVDEDDRQKIMVFDGNQNKETIVINESGLYSLVLSSKLPTAKKFRRWVTSEVLPSVRKNGGYIQNQENLSPEQIVANALIVANKIIEDMKKQLSDQKPLVEFANHVGQTADTVDMGQMAKLAKAEGIQIGRNRLINWMKEKNYLMSNGNPYQRYVECGYMKLVDVPKVTPYGTKNFTKTVFTGKGQIWIIEKLRSEHSNPNVKT